MRKKIIVGNWKMNLDYPQAMGLVDRVIQLTDDAMKTQIVLAPPFPYISEVELQVMLRTNIIVAAQNCSDKDKGAFTGEVSAAILRSIGAEMVIIGHSERRTYFNETDDVVAEKVKRTLENNLKPIFCCGETKEQRDGGNQLDVVKTQLTKGLFHLNKEQIVNVIVAYEPVWAIGTGVNATAKQAQEMHQHIRNLIKDKFGANVSDNISILYGGSVNAKNAAQIFSCKDVDGGLVGGASLVADEFVEIIKAAELLNC
jgi:triosephosphate isomerase